MSRIIVIGGANVDLCGSSISPLRNYDSNPGEISISFGGVGRNIAQICALLKQNVSFVTCFSSDAYGTMMKQDCEKLGMDTSYSKVVDDLPSSMYIAILDSNRDMKIGMSDMRILRKMDHEMLDRVLSACDPDDMIIIDANLDLACIGYILGHAGCAVAADPVSANKASRIKPYLSHLTIFKPNQYEANEMNGIFIKDEASAAESVAWYRKQGVKEIIISMADRGVVFGYDDTAVWLTHKPIQVANATGGGDTLLGAYVSYRLSGHSEMESIRYGMTAAAVNIEHDAVRRRSLDPLFIAESIENMKIKEKKLV